MKRIVQRIKSYSKSIELSEDDKDGLRANIVSFIKTHPIKEKTQTATFKSPYAAFLSPLRNPLAVTAIVALLTTSSITSAAEGALPGDILFPVKVYINEPINEVFAFGATAEAAWHAQRAERRFEEIERLIAEDKLNEEKAIIAQVHLDAALKDAGDVSNPVKFGAILDTHAALLAKINRGHFLESQMNISINETRKAITKKKYSNNNAQNNGEEILLDPTLATVSQKKAMADERIGLVKEAIADLDLDKKTQARVDAKLKQAENAYAKGSLAVDGTDYIQARDEFINSMMFLQEAKLMASVPKFLGLEDVVHTGTSSKDTMNESDVIDDDESDNRSTSTRNESSTINRNSKDSNDNDAREDNGDNDSESNNDRSNGVSDTVKKTEEKVKEVQNSIQDKVNKLIP